jgi:hypothetical protein
LFSEKLSNYFHAIFLENKALEYAWLKLKEFRPSEANLPDASKETSLEASVQRKLVREGIEYFILDRLSLNLTENRRNCDRHPRKK